MHWLSRPAAARVVVILGRDLMGSRLVVALAFVLLRRKVAQVSVWCQLVRIMLTSSRLAEYPSGTLWWKWLCPIPLEVAAPNLVIFNSLSRDCPSS